MINISEINKNPKKVKAYLLSHGWKKIEHTLFHLSNISDNTIIHCDNEKIYALSYIIYLDDHAMLHMFEVNKTYEHIGYGKKAMIEIAKTPIEKKNYLISHGWSEIEHTLFHLHNISDYTTIHYDDEKIYALSYLIYCDDHVILHMFEVNKAYEHIGYGKKAMIEIAKKVKSMGYDEIRLSSIDINSNGFYEHMGFKSKKPYRYYANVNDIINHDNKLNI